MCIHYDLEMMLRTTRILQPLGPRVLVRICEGETRSAGGLLLPQGVQEQHNEALYAKVIEVARDALSSEEVGENVSGIPIGVFVLFSKHAGLTVPWDDKLRLVDTKEIVAIVEEFEYEGAH